MNRYSSGRTDFKSCLHIFHLGLETMIESVACLFISALSSTLRHNIFVLRLFLGMNHIVPSKKKYDYINKLHTENKKKFSATEEINNNHYLY